LDDTRAAVLASWYAADIILSQNFIARRLHTVYSFICACISAFTITGIQNTTRMLKRTKRLYNDINGLQWLQRVPAVMQSIEIIPPNKKRE